MQVSRITLFALSLFTSLVLYAHHSTSFNYSEETVTLNGTVTNLNWVNPHSTLVLVVANADGSQDEYLVEFLARIALERGGFDFNALYDGLSIQLTGRIGFREGYLRFTEAVLEDGRVLRERLPSTLPVEETQP
ncbi:MAG: DUF6152 family protein [Candidatus Rariloculaceae bacterium]